MRLKKNPYDCLNVKKKRWFLIRKITNFECGKGFIMMKREISTTYEREMSDPEFRARFEMEYQEFSLSEMIHQLMEKDKVSIRDLAKTAGISPSIIQDIRSGARRNITLRNLTKILNALGCRVAVQDGNRYFSLSE